MSINYITSNITPDNFRSKISHKHGTSTCTHAKFYLSRMDVMSLRISCEAEPKRIRCCQFAGNTFSTTKNARLESYIASM